MLQLAGIFLADGKGDGHGHISRLPVRIKPSLLQFIAFIL
jgi:hypothetical protein